MTWASIAEVNSYTGVTVTDAIITAAQAMVEVFADTTEDSNDFISSKNMRLLKLAVAYQAAWMDAQPDVFTRSDVGLMVQDGLSFTSPHANSGILAPMASRAINRLSWRRTRNTRVRPPQRGNRHPLVGDPTNNDAESEDGSPGWECI